MAPTEDPSNIRVFVHWHDQTVFAGEEVKCTITFRNVATTSDQQNHQQKNQQTAQSDRHRLASSLNTRAKATASLSTPPVTTTGRGHRRSALSLSHPPSGSHNRTGSIQWPSPGSAKEGRSGHSHKRSVSIVSIGSASTIDDHSTRNESSSRPQRPARAHGRAASLQILPRGQPSPTAGPQSGMDTPVDSTDARPRLTAWQPHSLLDNPAHHYSLPPIPQIDSDECAMAVLHQLGGLADHLVHLQTPCQSFVSLPLLRQAQKLPKTITNL